MPVSFSCPSRYRFLPLATMLAAISGMSGCAGIQVSYAGQPVYTPSASAAAAQPAVARPPVAKDVGMFGNFEIGPGFGAQKASGYTGHVAGLMNGSFKRENLLPTTKKQTMEGDTIQIPHRNCENHLQGENMRYGNKPVHRLMVTSLLTVDFKVGFEDGDGKGELIIHGENARACIPFDGENMPRATLELLPGEYEIYAGLYRWVGGPDDMKYNLTLSERNNTHRQLDFTLTPGFGQLALETPPPVMDYLPSRPHQFTVTEPVWIQVEVETKNNSRDYFYLKIENQDSQFIEKYSKGYSEPIRVQLKPGSYQISGGFSIDNRAVNMYDGESVLRLIERSDLNQPSITLSQGFGKMAFKSAYAPNLIHVAEEGTDPDYVFNHISHEFTVASPMMVMFRITNRRLTSMLLSRRVSGEDDEPVAFVEAEEPIFLAPGQYSLLVQGGWGFDSIRGSMREYEFTITEQ